MNRRRFLRTAGLGLAGAGLGSLTGCARAAAGAKRGAGEDGGAAKPNVLLIMADDIGYADIGCYGAEIETPTLDGLARRGIRFTRFYNMAKCNPTRSTLLTGLYFRKRHSDNARSLGSLMRGAGYYAATSGKEHFDGWVPQRCYATESFDDAFTFRACTQYFIPPGWDFTRPFKLNGKVLRPEAIPVSRKPFYKTDVITDYALRFLEKAEAAHKPFFLYLPYHVAHYPLQARPEDIEKYRGRYRKGWDAVRAERFARQKALGVLPPNAKLSEPEDNIYPHRGDETWSSYRPWDEVPEAEKDRLDLEMAVFAAMIDRMDRNIARVLAKIEAMGRAENTLVLFLVDNGSCPFDNGGKRDPDAPLGSAGSYAFLRPAWACVGNTPWRYYKQYGHEGGPRTPFIAHWPGVIEPGITHQVGHVADILPTLLEAAGAPYPAEADGKPTPALDGSSLMPVFRGGKRPEPEMIVSGWKDDKRMVRVGDWKIVRVKNRPWELYHMAEDPSETNNLAEARPEKVREIVQKYEAWVQANAARPT